MLAHNNRLTNKSDFEVVRQNGKFFTTPLFSFSYFDKKNNEDPRFGFIVSKKISTKAHVRNRVKRILRELVRKNINGMKQGVDIVISVKPGIVHATNGTIETELVKCLKKTK